MTFSIEDFRRFSKGNSADALRFRLMFWKLDPPSYAEWSDLVENAISHEVSRISMRKNDLVDLSEDALTSVLVLALEALGLQASSSRVGGNCDVTIFYRDDYLWIGEAKIFSGVAHVWDGYQQLTTRYATGMPSHNRGGMLLYCQKARATELLAEWRAALRAEVPDADDRDGSLPLTFVSTSRYLTHEMPMTVTHFAFPLFHDPQDGEVKLSKASFKAGREARSRSRKGYV